MNYLFQINQGRMTAKVEINLIVAVCEGMGIGKGNQLPWRLKSEMAYFAKMTQAVSEDGVKGGKQNAVIMGRKTWESIPQKFRPLKNRLNIVLTSQEKTKISDNEQVSVFGSFEEAVEFVENNEDKLESCWVIGGSSVYKAALECGKCDHVFLTNICNKFDCDTFFPELDSHWQEVDLAETDNYPLVPRGTQSEGEIQFQYKVFKNKL